MKKWIVAAGILLFLFLVSIYLFIPNPLVVTKTAIAPANAAASHRFLSDALNWEKWWPSNGNSPRLLFESDGYTYKKVNSLFNSLEISIKKDQQALTSFLHFFPEGNDSVRLVWTTSIPTGYNPLTKLRAWFQAKALGQSQAMVSNAMIKYLGDVKNIYGIDIKREKVQIEFMVSAKKIVDHYPATDEIYAMLSPIKKYIAAQGAQEEDYPMVHVTPLDNSSFLTQVAIPVNRQLPDSGALASKRMLKNGNILGAVLTGGPYTTSQGMKLVEQYVDDYHFSNVALPYYSLITDRSAEADTSKWVTKIYYPIR